MSKIGRLIGGLLLFVTPVTTFAADKAGTVGCAIANNKLGDVINFYVCIVSRYTIIAAVLIVIAVGVMYIIGGFNPNVTSSAKSILVTTLTGLVFMFLITYILNVMISTGIMSKS